MKKTGVEKTELTSRQKRFVEAYAGNAAQAAIAAGYSAKTARSQGQRLLTKDYILKLINKREEKAIQSHIATRLQRQEFWTRIMQSGAHEMRDRLKASELLAKSEGDFLDRLELSGRLDLAVEINEARKRLSGENNV